MQSHTEEKHSQRFFDIHGVLLHVAEKDYDAYYHPFFQKRQYSLILRKACFEHNLALVELLLKYRDKINLNINEQSGNGHTALDWIFVEPRRSHHMQKLLSLMIAAGAKSSDELQPCQQDEDDENEPTADWPMSCHVQ